MKNRLLIICMFMICGVVVWGREGNVPLRHSPEKAAEFSCDLPAPDTIWYEEVFSNFIVHWSAVGGASYYKVILKKENEPNPIKIDTTSNLEISYSEIMFSTGTYLVTVYPVCANNSVSSHFKQLVMKLEIISNIIIVDEVSQDDFDINCLDLLCKAKGTPKQFIPGQVLHWNIYTDGIIHFQANKIPTNNYAAEFLLYRRENSIYYNFGDIQFEPTYTCLDFFNCIMQHDPLSLFLAAKDNSNNIIAILYCSGNGVTILQIGDNYNLRGYQMSNICNVNP